MVLSMVRIQLGENLPSNVRNVCTVSNGSREINLNRVDAGDMMHDDTDRTAITPITDIGARHSARKAYSEGSPSRQPLPRCDQRVIQNDDRGAFDIVRSGGLCLNQNVPAASCKDSRHSASTLVVLPSE